MVLKSAAIVIKADVLATTGFLNVAMSLYHFWERRRSLSMLLGGSIAETAECAWKHCLGLTAKVLIRSL